MKCISALEITLRFPRLFPEAFPTVPLEVSVISSNKIPEFFSRRLPPAILSEHTFRNRSRHYIENSFNDFFYESIFTVNYPANSEKEYLTNILRVFPAITLDLF